jgi:hypothetical protein
MGKEGGVDFMGKEGGVDFMGKEVLVEFQDGNEQEGTWYRGLVIDASPAAASGTGTVYRAVFEDGEEEALSISFPLRPGTLFPPALPLAFHPFFFLSLRLGPCTLFGTQDLDELQVKAGVAAALAQSGAHAPSQMTQASSPYPNDRTGSVPTQFQKRAFGAPVSHTEVEKLLQEMEQLAGSCGMELAGTASDVESTLLLANMWSAQVAPLQAQVAAWSVELKETVRKADREIEEMEVAEIVKDASMAFFSAADY